MFLFFKGGFYLCYLMMLKKEVWNFSEKEED